VTWLERERASVPARHKTQGSRRSRPSDTPESPHSPQVSVEIPNVVLRESNSHVPFSDTVRRIYEYIQVLKLNRLPFSRLVST